MKWAMIASVPLMASLTACGEPDRERDYRLVNACANLSKNLIRNYDRHDVLEVDKADNGGYQVLLNITMRDPINSEETSGKVSCILDFDGVFPFYNQYVEPSKVTLDGKDILP
jgi:hypothetical protein